MLSIEERAAAYIARMDGAESGSGGHTQTFYVACVLVQAFELSQSSALAIMQDYNTRCRPAWTEAELVYKVKSASNCAPGGKILELREKIRKPEGGDSPRARDNDADLPPMQPKASPPSYDAAKLKELASPWNEPVSSVWLANRSAVDPCELDADGFLRMLYPEGEKVLAFTNQKTQGQALWPDEKLPTWGREGVWFLPQPVDGNYYPNPRSVDKSGKPKLSRRSLESVTAWRYMLLESDEADIQDWLGLLVQLPFRISAIYSSGGRSVHALVRVDCKTKASWDEEKAALTPTINLLCMAGVDVKALTAVRLTRLPQCRRGKKPQKLFYLNPAPPIRPLIEMPTLRDVESEWCARALQGISDNDETGGRWLFEALRYYASASVSCREAYTRLKEEVDE